jgi:hypothetical protein
MRGRIVMWVLLAAAVVLVVIGAGVFLFAPVSFGWFTYTSYAPDANLASFDFSGMYPLTPERAAGAVCAIIGLLLAAGVFGWVLGRRSALKALFETELPQPNE